ncbi:MAG: AI-2E family transporter [Hyphomicrobiaceae bacterium]
MQSDYRDPVVSLQGLMTAAYLMLLLVLTGWLLYIGKGILIPIFTAIISVYVLTSAADAVGRLPGGRLLPSWLRRVVVLLIFIGALVALASVVVLTAEQMVAKASLYQNNLQKLISKFSNVLGLEADPDWLAMRRTVLGWVNIESLVGTALGSIGGMAGSVFMIAVYAAFLMAEQHGFSRKLATALRDPEQAERAGNTIRRINERIGDYLGVKTLVNIILALMSYSVLKFWNVDFALFWALVIGILNYIPYVGSLLGVAFPVVVCLVQFGSIWTAAVVCVLLTIAQFFVGNVLEPRVIGQRLNLSPFVVLASLAIWSALWGIAGAILAIPLTSVLAVLLAVFPLSRPMAVLLADDVEAFIVEERTHQA